MCFYQIWKVYCLWAFFPLLLTIERERERESLLGNNVHDGGVAVFSLFAYLDKITGTEE